jgi:hypothetical protein
MKAGKFEECAALLKQYDDIGYVRLNILHDALGAMGFSTSGHVSDTS